MTGTSCPATPEVPVLQLHVILLMLYWVETVKMMELASPWITIISTSWVFLALRKDVIPPTLLLQKISLVDHHELGSHVGISTDGVNPWGFGWGYGRVGVRVEIFHPANDPTPDSGSSRYQSHITFDHMMPSKPPHVCPAGPSLLSAPTFTSSSHSCHSHFPPSSSTDQVFSSSSQCRKRYLHPPVSATNP